MLSGANDLRAILRRGCLTPKALRALDADAKRRKAPAHATYHYVCQSIFAAELIAALGVLVQAEGGPGHVAIDGKRLRGSQHATSPGVHMLHAFSTKLQAAVGSLLVPPDSGECVVVAEGALRRDAIEPIKPLPLDGAVVSGDAAFTTKPIVEAIRERGGAYFRFVKANQLQLRSELERACRVEDARLRHDDASPSGDHRRNAGAVAAAERRDPPDLKRAESRRQGPRPDRNAAHPGARDAAVASRRPLRHRVPWADRWIATDKGRRPHGPSCTLPPSGPAWRSTLSRCTASTRAGSSPASGGGAARCCAASRSPRRASSIRGGSDGEPARRVRDVASAGVRPGREVDRSGAGLRPDHMAKGHVGEGSRGGRRWFAHGLRNRPGMRSTVAVDCRRQAALDRYRRFV